MFSITKDAISISDLSQNLPKNIGGIVTFEGRVRNHNVNRSVEKLEYEAFEDMAISEGNSIIKEATTLFDIEEAFCIHRVGMLDISDVAIWIVVFSEHRKAAFDACEFIIDQVKERVPIWKKEFYIDGKTSWVKCLACSAKGVTHSEHFHHVE